MDNQKIGGFIAAMRKERGLTQKELGSRLHVSDRAVSKWERGLNLPDAALFEPLCRELDITVTELLRGERVAATVPELERVVVETVSLAGRKERKVRNLKRLTAFLLCIIGAAAIFIGPRLWKEYQQYRLWNRDSARPFVTISCKEGGSDWKRVEFTPYAHGMYGPFESDGSLFQSKLEIELPQGWTPYLRTLDADRVWFTVEHEKRRQELAVYRWPVAWKGSGVGLEEGEPVEFEPWTPGEYSFRTEPGYLYSILITWGEGYYAEYPFETI